ncbi:MAG: hypothetical protein QM796_02140 [Chthoniobacteraceae bacterium]
MSFNEQVLQKTQRLEQLLIELGGTGEGVYDLARSINPPLDQRLLSRLGMIAAVRNKITPDEEYAYPHDEEQFIAGCDAAILQLWELLESGLQLPLSVDVKKAEEEPVVQGRSVLVLVGVIICALLAGMLALRFFNSGHPAGGAVASAPPSASASAVASDGKASPSASASASAQTSAAPKQEQFATVEEAKAEAVRRYPNLGIEGTDFNLAFIERYQIYKIQNPDFLKDPSWPLRIAEEIANDKHVHQ